VTESQKKWIDNANYEELLSRWRFAPLGDSMFQGDTGDYYSKIMREKRESMENDEHVNASKRIGWQG